MAASLLSAVMTSVLCLSSFFGPLNPYPTRYVVYFFGSAIFHLLVERLAGISRHRGLYHISGMVAFALTPPLFARGARDVRARVSRVRATRGARASLFSRYCA